MALEAVGAQAGYTGREVPETVPEDVEYPVLETETVTVAETSLPKPVTVIRPEESSATEPTVEVTSHV
jgi:hypothetical protein